MGKLVDARKDKKLRAAINPFLKLARDDLKKIGECENELKASKKKLAGYLCEKAEKFDLSECFRTIIEFKMKFQRAALENHKREETKNYCLYLVRYLTTFYLGRVCHECMVFSEKKRFSDLPD